MIRAALIALATASVVSTPSRAVDVEIVGPTVLPGETAELFVSVRFDQDGYIDLTSEITLPSVARAALRSNGRPECSMRSGVWLTSGFRLSPPGCLPESNCTGISVFATVRDAPEDGIAVIGCALVVPAGTLNGSYPITCGPQLVATANAEIITLSCSDGRLTVVRCDGDCDQSGQVKVAEIIRGINIALGEDQLENCDAMDSDGDGAVDVAEVLSALENAISGCSR
jgi:hypothetical protein